MGCGGISEGFKWAGDVKGQVYSMTSTLRETKAKSPVVH